MVDGKLDAIYWRSCGGKRLHASRQGRLELLNAQDIANTAWVFVTLKQTDEKLCTALARAAERQVSEFSKQGLANTA